MPLFPQVNGEYTFGGKTHTNLVVSEGAVPSEHWIVAKEENENVKFVYPFGPEGSQNVVLAKGKIVELGAAEYDSETSRNISTVKTATAGSQRAVGVNHHNVYQRRRDRYHANQNNPTLLTRSYIEVPFFEHADENTASQMAGAMNYGAAYGAEGNALQPGDFVKVGQNGNFEKLDTATDSPFQIVGQVLAAERELPPAGFLQYYLEMDIPELEAFLKGKSHAPSPGKNGNDAGAYPYGYPYQNKGWQADFEKLLNPVTNKGIPFLTDGYFAAKQTLTGISMDDIYDATSNNDGHIERVDFSGQVTLGTSALDGATAGDTDDLAFTAGANATSAQVAAESRNAALFIKLRHPIDKGEADPVQAKFQETNGDAGTFSGQDLHVDYTHNVVVLYLEPGKTYHNITLDAKLVVDPVAGVPTEWDYAGSVGAVRILLQR